MKTKIYLLFLIAFFFFACPSTKTSVRGPEVPEERLEAVSYFLSLGDAEKAIEVYEQAVKEKPGEPTTKVLYARLLILANRLDEANKELSGVLQADPQNTDALFASSLIYGLKGDNKNQKLILEKVVKFSPEHSEALASLGLLALEEKNYNLAREYFTKALKADEKNLTAILGLGHVSYREKKWEEALKYFNQAIVVDPNYSFSYSDRALTKRMMNDLNGALADLNRASELEPEYAYNYYDRGRIFMDQGRLSEALKEFDLALEKDPELFAAYVMRAGLNDDLGNIDKAIRDYEKILKLKKGYFYAYAQLGSLYMLKERYVDAHHMFEKAFLAEPELSEYALLATLALKKAKKEEEAVKYLNKKLGLFPKDQWQYQVALFYITPNVDFNVLNTASREKNAVLKGRILYYIAEQYLLINKIGAAKTYLNEAANIQRSGLIEKKLAAFALSKL